MAGSNDWQYSSRSQDVEEIIGTPANWAARYGTIFLFVIMVLLFAAAWFVPYPSYVTGKMTLTSVNPPRVMRAQQDFTIAEVIKRHKDTIPVGQTILVANRAARYEHISYLEDELIAARSATDSLLLGLNIPPNLLLGQLETPAANFRRQQESYRDILARRLEGLTTKELQEIIRDRERFIRSETRRRVELEDQLILDRRNRDRALELSRDGIDNRRELTSARLRVEATEEELQRARTAISDADYEKEVARNRLNNFGSIRPANVTQAQRQLRQSFEDLVDAIADWKKNYAVVSPVEGVVLLAPDVRDGEFVFRGTPLATVIPVNSGDAVGRIDMSIAGSGRVREGQNVLVRFDKYPYLEFGAVRGVVLSRNEVPFDDLITVQVGFPDGMVTTTGMQLESIPLMVGEAYIETGKERVLTRFLDRF